MSVDPVLAYLAQPLSSLPGSGPKARSLLTRLVGQSVIDLLYHFPSQIQTRIYFSSIKDLHRALSHHVQNLETPENDFYATLTLKVSKITWPSRRGLPIKIQLQDETGSLDVVYFSLTKPYLLQKFPQGSTQLISGKVTFYKNKLQMTHPDFVGDSTYKSSFTGSTPLYPLTAGLSHRIVGSSIQKTLDHLKILMDKSPTHPLEWIPDERLRAFNWPSWIESLTSVHQAMRPEDLDPLSPARMRLAYDEILAHQLTLQLSRQEAHKKPGRSLVGSKTLIKNFIASLPFSLTPCQHKAIEEIHGDMKALKPMLRLLQGDVGSGKTVVAFISALNALTNGVQVAFMAPTEILARQHFETLKKWCMPLGFCCAYLQGGLSTSLKGKALKEDLAQGKIHLVVGTHALLEDDVQFQDLGLMIIDEQHRFGVDQRLRLYNKGFQPDLLVTSATPIPRTLQLAQFGDLDVSTLRSKPHGRQPIGTHIFPEDRLESICEKLIALLEKNQKIYWVCPLVEESESLDLTPAIERHKKLSERYPNFPVSLLHGQMKAAQKQEIMAHFAQPGPHILVATTVVEVGMDIPDATLMVIEHAERFGLSQLHQLRGRVGRSPLASHCFLIYAQNLSPVARQRLFVLKNLQDGFKLAEEDLRLRGYGCLLGTSQSGVGTYRALDPYSHGALFDSAQKDARTILQKDPLLSQERSQSLWFLLNLFHCQKALHYLKAG